jgi:hypothetical protein
MYGSSITVPVGAVIQLGARSDTSSGPRWTARWRGEFLNSIPEDMIKGVPDPFHQQTEPLPDCVKVHRVVCGPDSAFAWSVCDPIDGKECVSGRESYEPDALHMAMDFYEKLRRSGWKRKNSGPALPSEPCPSPSFPPLPSGVTVENQELGWQWIVRNPFTSQVLERGAEASEIEARKMAFAAYDRSTEEETPLASRESGDGSREQETTLEKFEQNSPGFKQRLLAQLRARYRPRLVDRLFQLLETPTAELTANDRRIVNDLFSSLCILNTAAGVVDNRTSGPIRSGDLAPDSRLQTSDSPAG